MATDREPEDEDFDRLPDEAEADIARRQSEETDGPAKQRGRVLTFLRACVQELKRVEWPDRRHVFQATAVVLGFVVVAGAWLGLMDAVWQPVMEAIL